MQCHSDLERHYIEKKDAAYELYRECWEYTSKSKGRCKKEYFIMVTPLRQLSPPPPPKLSGLLASRIKLYIVPSKPRYGGLIQI